MIVILHKRMILQYGSYRELQNLTNVIERLHDYNNTSIHYLADRCLQRTLTLRDRSWIFDHSLRGPQTPRTNRHTSHPPWTSWTGLNLRDNSLPGGGECGGKTKASYITLLLTSTRGWKSNIKQSNRYIRMDKLDSREDWVTEILGRREKV